MFTLWQYLVLIDHHMDSSEFTLNYSLFYYDDFWVNGYWPSYPVGEELPYRIKEWSEEIESLTSNYQIT